MDTFLVNMNPIVQALLATLFTWGLTALGAAGVFLTKTVNKNLLDGMLGFAGGVMTAASYWSLLAPAIEMAEGNGLAGWIPAASGFLLGGGFLYLVDKILPHMHLDMPSESPEGLKTSWERSILLVLAITLHNFPEGLAVGVAFGAAAIGLPEATLSGAIALAIGIGIQNFPEGLAVSAPLRREGLKAGKSFLYGQFSGMVEPVAGILGASLVLLMRPILPYALSFAAGAMIYVVVEELVPEASRGKHSDIPTIGFMLGFAVMMILDVALG
ncbi:MAG: ZIP family metal transporter [Anaerolineaceae bacterium]|nr:ZIP family metal transporter [Anaerolineaceae bacterium]